MKALNLILLIFFYFSETNNPVIKTDPYHKDAINLKGQVKSVKTKMFDIEEDKEVIYEQEIMLFNKKGFKIEEASYNADGSLDYIIKYKYDTNYNLIEKNRNAPNDERIEKEQYLYDKNNNLVELKKYENEKLYYKIIYEYDDRNNKIEEQHHNSGKLKIKTVFKYDDNNDKVEQLRYNSKKELEFKTFYTYNNQHQIIILKSFYGIYSNYEFATKKTFTYNDKGDKTEIVEYNVEDIPKEREEFKYNENRDMTFINTFNANGVLINSNETNYILDHKSNWIKFTSYHNGNKSRIWVREIEYFK
jgi:hypothetical protein